jgi:hypothetical protein
MHVHVSLVTSFVTFLSVIIIGAFWRLLSMRLSETSIGKAMAFVY